MLCVLYHVICSQWHPITHPGIDNTCMNVSRVGYIRLDTDSPFCHLCMTAVQKAKWLASTKKAKPALPSLPYLLFTYRKELSNCCFKEIQNYITIANVTRKQTKLYVSPATGG